jgi:endonuclease YncB( thermonuclease family)
MHTYNAKVLRVVDADTFDLLVDLGFNVTIKERFRLAVVDAPESWRPKTKAEGIHGELAKSVIETLLNDKDITVNTYKGDKYGRWLCDIIVDKVDVAEYLKENDLVKRASYSD